MQALTQEDPSIQELRFAPTTFAEQEVTVQLDAKERVAHVCSCWPDRTKRLIKRYGSPDRVSTDREGRVTAAFWKLPMNRVSFRGPVRRAPMSEAQREAARTRLRNARFARKAL